MASFEVEEENSDREGSACDDDLKILAVVPTIMSRRNATKIRAQDGFASGALYCRLDSTSGRWMGQTSDIVVEQRTFPALGCRVAKGKCSEALTPTLPVVTRPTRRILLFRTLFRFSPFLNIANSLQVVFVSREIDFGRKSAIIIHLQHLHDILINHQIFRKRYTLPSFD